MPSARTAYNALKSHDGMLKVENTRKHDKIGVTDPIQDARGISPERRALVNNFLDKSTFLPTMGI